MAQQTRDMTRGKPLGHIIKFALPLMFGSVFQQLYTIVDAAVVGRGVGVDALAAVGATDWLTWLVLGLSLGLAQGFSILVSQRFGAQDYAGLRRAAALSVELCAVSAIFIMAAGMLSARPVLTLLRTPPEILGQSLSYLYIIYAGIPISMGYNLLASLLRALGDSRTPLIAMIIAALINIALDLLFVMVFHWGIPGVAIATLIAQAFSLAFCFLRMRKISYLELERGDWRFDRADAGHLLRLGVPVALQNAIISAGGLAVQYVVNGFGMVFVAGYTTANKLYGLLELASTSYGYSMTTYMGQNIGAKKYKRMRQGLRCGAITALITSVGITGLIFLFGRWITSLFVDAADPNAPEVLAIAFRFLCILGVFLSILYMLHIYRASLQGMGDTFMPMVSGIVELIMRVGAAIILPRFIAQDGVFAAEILAWTGAAVILIITYYVRIGRYPNADFSVEELGEG